MRDIDKIKLSKQYPNYSVKALKFTLSKAVKNKTKLLILNISKSWELAEDLADLSIPIIVFHYPIPYYLVPLFLSSFTEEINLGKPLYLALKKAKMNLKTREPQSSYYSWFPVLVENLTE